MKWPETTAGLDFIKAGTTTTDYNGNTYSLDRLIDLIAEKPRPIERLPLDGWFTERVPGPFGIKESVLVSPNMRDEHIFAPSCLRGAKEFPALVCRQGKRVWIADGIHRITNAVRRKRPDYPCIYFTAAELKKCRVE